jgi:hypothetical protein
VIGRRALLTGALAVLAPGCASAMPPELRFNVMRNGSAIGHHVVTFRQDGDTLLASTAVDIAVRFGPLVLFRYTHSVRETWRNGQFVTLDSDTDDNGTPWRVHAVRAGDHVLVEGLEVPARVLPPATVPLTHWNILCTERPLFNPQDGVPVESSVVPRGEDMVPLADGTTVRAAHYSLVGKVALDDWYDDSRVWTALRSVGKDGSTIDYRRAA